MNNLNKNLFLTIALLCGVFFLANCGGGATSTTSANNGTTNKPADAPKANAPKTDAPKSDAPKTETASTDSVGVAECDEYIKKYEACLTKIAKNAPQVEATMKTAFQQQRDGFKQAAANPQAKAMLATQCKQAIETAKTATASTYACEW